MDGDRGDGGRLKPPDRDLRPLLAIGRTYDAGDGLAERAREAVDQTGGHFADLRTHRRRSRYGLIGAQRRRHRHYRQNVPRF